MPYETGEAATTCLETFGTDLASGGLCDCRYSFAHVGRQFLRIALHIKKSAIQNVYI